MMYKLPKQAVLRKNKQFQSVYRYGRSYLNRYLVLYVLSNREADTKVGFAAGKRLGNAVVRNRTKRLMREAFRLHRSELKGGIHILMVGRNPIVGVKYQVVDRAFRDLCQKAGLIDK